MAKVGLSHRKKGLKKGVKKDERKKVVDFLNCGIDGDVGAKRNNV